MNELNLDAIGEIMDRFLRDNEIRMAIKLPEGELDPVIADNVRLGSVVRFYILLNAIKPVCVSMCDEMCIDRKSDGWPDVVDALLRMVRSEILKDTDDDGQ